MLNISSLTGQKLISYLGTDMGFLASDASPFEGVEYIPPDAIFDLTRLYLADPNARKVNLGQGTYKDENGNPWILPSVRAAKETIRDANHEYLPILGLATFRTLATQLVYGDKSRAISEERVSAVLQRLRRRRHLDHFSHLVISEC